MKSYRVKVNLDNFRKTQSGKPQIWRSDLVPTHCCSFQESYFVWEKSTKYNGYNGYSGYIDPKYVEKIA